MAAKRVYFPVLVHHDELTARGMNATVFDREEDCETFIEAACSMPDTKYAYGYVETVITGQPRRLN